jgi:hypothetical protein
VSGACGASDQGAELSSACNHLGSALVRATPLPSGQLADPSAAFAAALWPKKQNVNVVRTEFKRVCDADLTRLSRVFNRFNRFRLDANAISIERAETKDSRTSTSQTLL